MATSTNLNLPYLLAAQSQKHLTHNEALRALDAVVQIAVEDRNLATPPASPTEGVRYLVAASATAAWAGQSGTIAAYQDGAWAFYIPRKGWAIWVADEAVLLVFDGLAWQPVTSGGGGGGTGRPRLTANRTYYVRSNGSDSNDGLSDTAGGAFLTPQKAADTVMGLDFNGFIVNIRLNGAFTTGFLFDRVLVGAPYDDPVIITGDDVTPSNVTIARTSGDCLTVWNGARVRIRGVKLSTTTGNGINVAYNGYVAFDVVDFGYCGGDQIVAPVDGQFRALGAVTLSGGAGGHFLHVIDGSQANMANFTLTFAGTPAYGGRFIGINYAKLRWEAVTVVGSCTGIRFLVHRDGLLDTAGALPTVIPGSLPGIRATGGQFLGTDSSDAKFKNRLINGAMQVNQRAPATNADATYAHDRWRILTQTGAVAVTTALDLTDGLPQAMRITQSQATAQRIGISQAIESVQCRDLRNGQAAFSAWVRCSVVAAVRMTILSRTDANDVVPADVIADWTSGAYTPGNFFVSGTTAVVATASLALAANNTGILSCSGTVPSGMRNLICVITVDGVVAQNVTLDIGNCQLERGSSVTDFQTMDVGENLAACRRYYQEIGYANGAIKDFGLFTATSATNARAVITYPTAMRASPACALKSGATAGNFLVTAPVGGGAASAFAPAVLSDTCATLDFTTTGMTAGQCGWVRANVATGLLTFSAEI